MSAGMPNHQAPLNGWLTGGGKHAFELRILGAVLGAGVLGLSWFHSMLFPDQADISILMKALASLCLALPVFWMALKGFLKGAGQQVTEQLAFVAILAALSKEDYTTATLLPLFMLIGHILEERSVLGAQAAMEGLGRLTARTVTVLGMEGLEREVPSEDLEMGNIMVVRPGESFPADGTILKGTSSVDQSPITGESVPRDVGAESSVYAGSVNLSGVLHVRVTKVGTETALGKVKALLHAAQRSKTPIVKSVEKYAVHYLPFVLVVAGAVLFATRDMDRAITVLVVSCPCAFVLSSPAAMIAALAVAARFGILIKSTHFLERLMEVDTLVLDKTGTLTLGQLEVVEGRPSDSVDEDTLLEAAATVASGSHHPVCRAISQAAANRGVLVRTAAEVTEEPGKGIVGRSGNTMVGIGRSRWLKEEGFKVPDAPHVLHTGPVVWVATKEQTLGVFLMADRPRAEVTETLGSLKDLGVARIAMLTGDRKNVAEALGRELDLDAVSYELLPEQKLEAVKQEKAHGHTVMVVGDGINDALALAAGDVGVAMGAMGSEVAIQSADMALMHNDLRGLTTAVRLSRETTRIIHINLFGGAGFSVLMLTLAALGIIAPLTGALLHNLGALFVVFNSARLLKFQG